MSGAASFELRRSARRRTLALRLLPDGRLRVLAPVFVPECEVRAWVAEKADWIARHRARLARERAWIAARRLEHGGAVEVLGEMREIHCGAEAGEGLRAGCVHLALPADADRAAVAARLAGVLRDAALAHFQSRAQALARGVHPRAIAVKDWKSRWGACHPDGRIALNWRLMLAPGAVADYVLAHELAHLRHRNHSPAFWREVARLFPACDSARDWLRREGWRLRLEA